MSLFATFDRIANHLVVSAGQDIASPLDGKVSLIGQFSRLWEIIKAYHKTVEPTLAILMAIGFLGGIALGIFKVVRWISQRKKTHQAELQKLRNSLIGSYRWVHSTITKSESSTKHYADALKFYMGAVPNPLHSVAPDWFAPREDVDLIIKNHYIKPSRSYSHIHVEGNRSQGKTAVLWLLAHQLAKGGSYEVLWHNREPNLLPSEIGKYAKSLTPGPIVFWIRKIFRRSPKRLIIFLDDFEADNISQDLLQMLHGYPLSLVTASTPGQQLSVPVYHLRLTLVDAEHIVNTFNRNLALSNPITLDQVMLHLKGVRGFDYDLVSLMYQLLSISIEKNHEIVQPFLDCVKKNEDGFKYIAVCEALELEAFTRLIGFCVNVREPHIFEARLLHDAQGWIVKKKLSYADGEGLALSSPFLAVWLLTEYYKIDAPKFADLLNELIKKISSPAFWDMDIAQEFLRHIFHKLGKGRHLHFPGLNGRVLGKKLFSQNSQLINSIMEMLSKSGNIDRLCHWASTASLMGDNHLSEELCKKIITQMTSQAIKVTDGATFVTFMKALTNLDRDSVQIALEKLLDLDQVISEFMPGYTTEFRFNEIIHAYIHLLWLKLGDINKALAVYEKVSHYPLDAINLCQRAALLGQVNLEQAKDAYETACKLAYSPKYYQMNPTHVVRCHFEYARFLCNAESDKDAAWREFQKAFDLASPTSGSGLNPEQVPDILCAWAQCLEKNERHQNAWQKYEESLKYCLEALYPPQSHWKTVKKVAQYRKLSCDPNGVMEAIHIIEKALNDETVKHQYDDGFKLYKECWERWLKIIDVSLFDFKYIKRALSQPWSSTFAAQLARYLIVGLLARANVESNDKTRKILVEYVIDVYEELFQRPNQVNNEQAINALSKFVAGRKFTLIGDVDARQQKALEILKKIMYQQVKNQAAWDALIWIGSQLHEETGREGLRNFVKDFVTRDASACEEFKKLESKWKNEEGTKKLWRLEKVFPDTFRATIV